jgi:chromosome segregation ATPase
MSEGDQLREAKSELGQCRADMRMLRAKLAKTESERDTARAELKAANFDRVELGSHWQAEIEQHTALQAKVARAVALLENHVLPLCSEEGDIEHAVKQTLEALR